MVLGCETPKHMYFDRKNYYYPDLPKGFQITQETKPNPVGIYGKVNYNVNGVAKTVRINNIHLEEDTASLDHYSSTSNLNYNRAGVPLLELVKFERLGIDIVWVALLEQCVDTATLAQGEKDHSGG